MNYNVPTEMRSMMIAEETVENDTSAKKSGAWSVVLTVAACVMAIALCGAAFFVL